VVTREGRNDLLPKELSMTPPPGSDRFDDGEPPRDGGPQEAAHYIKSALEDLARVAQRHGHGMLVYLIDMAHMEAEEILRQAGKRRSAR
jgi:hypothetical protein